VPSYLRADGQERELPAKSCRRRWYRRHAVHFNYATGQG